MFAKIANLDSDSEFEAAAMESIAALSSSSGTAVRRLGLLVRLYNIVPNRRGAKLAAVVAVLRLARENRLLGRLRPFLQTVQHIPTRWCLSGADSRTLLSEAAVGAATLGDTTLAQTLRTAHLRTLQGADAALLKTAEPVAVAAAAGFIRAPVASQRSNLPALDAVRRSPRCRFAPGAYDANLTPRLTSPGGRGVVPTAAADRAGPRPASRRGRCCRPASAPARPPTARAA